MSVCEQGLAEGGDGVDEGGSGEFGGGAVTPGDREGGDAAVGGGAHVGGGVADQNGVFRGDACPAEYLAYDVRRGLEGPSGAVPEYGYEADAAEEVPDEVLGAFLELVGRYGELDASFLQLRQQLGDAGVGVCADVDVGGVVRLEVGQSGVYQRLVRYRPGSILGTGPARGFRPGSPVCPSRHTASLNLKGGFQGLGHEVADSVADHAAVFVQGVKGKAAQGQRVVDGGAEVLEGVEESAVQVEENQLFHNANIQLSRLFYKPGSKACPQLVKLLLSLRMGKRLIWADSLKGWLILLVILGHSMQGVLGDSCQDNHLWNIIYSFHIPAFMALSGFLAFRPEASGVARPASLLPIIVRRFRQLIVPFVIWTIVLLLCSNKLTPENIGSYILYPDKGLWFLWVLFLIAVIFAAGNKLSECVHVRQEMVIAALCLLFAASMVLFEIRILGFQFLAYYFTIYSLGFFLHKYYNQAVTKKALIHMALALCWAVLAWFWRMHELPAFMSSVHVPGLQYLYRFVTAALAVYLLLALAPMVLDSTGKWNKPFVRLGSVSLGIYVVHYIFLGRVISWFCGIGLSDMPAILLSFATALLASWLAVWLISKWKPAAKLLLGKI